MGFRVLPTTEFYAAEERFWQEVDPDNGRDQGGWRDAVDGEAAAVQEALVPLLGPLEGRRILDASCGTGNQALALARLGARVVGADISGESLRIARSRAAALEVEVDLRHCAMQELHRHFAAEFESVITCGALDNITEDSGIEAALVAMRRVLRPGGVWYAWLRDVEWVLAHETRYKCKGERLVPHGRVITVEDWHTEGETHVVHVYAHLHEDDRRRFPDERWKTTALGYRRRRLPKDALARHLEDAGFAEVRFLPQPYPWNGYRIIAMAPAALLLPRRHREPASGRRKSFRRWRRRMGWMR